MYVDEKCKRSWWLLFQTLVILIEVKLMATWSNWLGSLRLCIHLLLYLMLWLKMWVTKDEEILKNQTSELYIMSCYNKHPYALYHDFCSLTGSDSWFLNDTIHVVNVSLNVSLNNDNHQMLKYQRQDLSTIFFSFLFWYKSHAWLISLHVWV